MTLSPHQRGAMLARIATIEAELGQLIESVQVSADRVSADLELLRKSLEVDAGASDPVQVAAAGSAGSVQVAAAEPAGSVQAADGASAAPTSEPDQSEDARLVALNMALDGTSRDETDRYLAAHFRIAKRAALLDEVYASIGG